VPIRWIIVRDPTGTLDPQAFLSTDLNASPKDIIAWFVSRWNIEVTFQEVRAHLGVETQRQWSDNAILRTTPALLALYSIITLLSHDIFKQRKLKPRTAAWYTKSVLTFSDAIAAIRREIWLHQISFMSRPHRNSVEIPRHIWNRVQDALAYAA
jgi:Archaeal putative transposase ISC1217